MLRFGFKYLFYIFKEYWKVRKDEPILLLDYYTRVVM